LNRKSPYQPEEYFSSNNIGNSFFINTILYFIYTISFNLIIFLIGKILLMIVTIFFKKIPQELELYKFNFYLVFMILQGNCQIFSYYFTSDLVTLFSFDANMKIINFFILLTHFKFVFIIITAAFLAIWHYSINRMFRIKTNKFQKCIYFFVS
jgi:hypothetical protein